MLGGVGKAFSILPVVKHRCSWFRASHLKIRQIPNSRVKSLPNESLTLLFVKRKKNLLRQETQS